MPHVIRKDQKIEYRYLPKWVEPTAYAESTKKEFLQTFIEISQWVNGKIWGSPLTFEFLTINFMNHKGYSETASQGMFIVKEAKGLVLYTEKEFNNTFQKV